MRKKAGLTLNGKKSCFNGRGKKWQKVCEKIVPETKVAKTRAKIIESINAVSFSSRITVFYRHSEKVKFTKEMGKAKERKVGNELICITNDSLISFSQCFSSTLFLNLL